MTAPPVAVSPALPPVDQMPAEPSRILLHDNDAQQVEEIRAYLQDKGLIVVGPASSAHEAVALARTHRPDIAIMAVDERDDESVAAVRAISQQRCIPVIALCSGESTADIQHASSLGAWSILMRPVSGYALHAALTVAWARILDTAHMRAEITSLTTRLEQRKLIEQAKWILVKRRQISEPEAMKILQQHARNSRRRIVDVAQSVLDNEMLLGDGTTPTP